MPRVYLLHGLPGTGKTTYAAVLVSERGAIRLSNDELMRTIFGENPSGECFTQMRGKIDAVIWDTAAKLVARGIDVVLDNGFWTRKSRDEAREKTYRIGGEPVLVRMLCPHDVAYARVLARNNALPKDALFIDENALHLFRENYEPPEPDEACEEVSGM